MKRTIFFIATFCLGFYACKKESKAPLVITPAEENKAYHQYFPMSIGSFWVYEFDTHLPNGTIIDNNIIDTMKIVGDTLINEEEYFVFKKGIPSPNSTFYRRMNESGEIVSQNHQLICPPNLNYSEVYNAHYGFSGSDTAYYYWENFSGLATVNSKLGNTYNCIQMTAYHQAWPSFGSALSADTNYFSSIGMLQRSYSYLSGSKQVGTLIDYQLR